MRTDDDTLDGGARTGEGATVRGSGRRPIAWLAIVGVALVGVVAAHGSGDGVMGAAVALATVVQSGTAPFAWMIAAAGLGAIVLRAMRRDENAGTPAGAGATIGVGVALMLWLSHLMGVAGALRTGWAGLVVAWMPVIVGLGALVWCARRRAIAPWRAAPDVALCLVPLLGAAVLLVAACVPPGTLWRSEAGQFDTLSYHLQLPREWLGAGRLWPHEHNAYSWLPGYVEAAFLHISAMTWPPGDARDPAVVGLPTHAILGAQLLHALITLAAAWAAADAARAVVRCFGLGAHEKSAALCGSVVASAVLLTPWTIVVGASAYNESAVLLMLASAVAIAGASCSATGARGAPGVRDHLCIGALVGLLVGAACGAKPTSLWMAGIPAGIAMLAMIRRGEARWMQSAIARCAGACIAGILMIAPWLVRNWLASGNPVFPQGASVFGPGPWTELELARWAAGHHSDLSLASRAALLADDRGYGHAQWWITPWLALACGVGLLMVSRGVTRLAAAMLCAGLFGQIAAWMLIGHQQSRFLTPSLVPMAVLIALLVAAATAGAGWRGPRARVMVIVMQAAMAAGCVRVWLAENDGVPARTLVPGVEAITGELVARAWPTLDAAARQEMADALSPTAMVNLTLAPGAALADPRLSRTKLLLVGDSTPLYFKVPTLWHTTWSISPIGAMVRAGMSASEIAARLAAAEPQGLGVTHVLVNFDELARLRGEGWYDPDVTPELAATLIERHGRLLWAWPGGAGGSALFELTP